MKEYNVVFHYSVRVEADDEDDAQDKAWSEFGVVRYSRTASSEFDCTVEAIVDTWDTNEDGNHICVDCETEVDPDEVCGNREFSDPRCEGCYDTHRYSA
tara:strand:+ start:1069 stop:1365 length:297 start_codon:yes stop_codon:yes gene_type:complete